MLAEAARTHRESQGEVFAGISTLMCPKAMGIDYYGNGAALAPPSLPDHGVLQYRTLNEQSTCSSFHAFNSTFNSNPDVPSYTGIMFEVVALKDIEVLTMELDVTLLSDSLQVEIFSMAGPFDFAVGHPEAWDLVTDTRLVPTPEGTGAIVPAEDFRPVSLKAYDLHSFYVTLTGPYLDHSVDALQKRGEEFAKNNDLKLLVGAGTTEYKFPMQMDTVLNPQFAGVIHYKVTEDCQQREKITTVIEYIFLTDLSRDNFDDSFQDAMEDYYEDVIEREMSDKIETPSLSTSTTVMFTGECPVDWRDCPSVMYSLKVSFVHNQDLSAGMVAFEFFKPDLLDRVQNEVGRRKGKMLYLGSTSAATTFSFELFGPRQISARAETDYLEYVTEQFLQETVPTDEATVWGVHVDALADGEANNGVRRRSQTASSTVAGIVYGAVPVGARSNSLRFALDAAIDKNKDFYLSLLQTTGRLRPGHEGWSAFSNIEDVATTFQSLALDDFTNRGNAKKVVGSIFTVAGAVSFLLAGVFLFRHYQMKRKRYRELEEYREERRRKRRANRESRRLQPPSNKTSENVMRSGDFSPYGSLPVQATTSFFSTEQSINDQTDNSTSTTRKDSPLSSRMVSSTTRALSQHLELSDRPRTIANRSTSFSIGSYSSASIPPEGKSRSPTKLPRDSSIRSRESTARENKKPNSHSARLSHASSRKGASGTGTAPMTGPNSAESVQENRTDSFSIRRGQSAQLRENAPRIVHQLSNSPAANLDEVEVTLDQSSEEKELKAHTPLPTKNSSGLTVNSDQATNCFDVEHQKGHSTHENSMYRAHSFQISTNRPKEPMRRSGSSHFDFGPLNESSESSPSSSTVAFGHQQSSSFLATRRAFPRARSHSPGLDILPATLPKRVARSSTLDPVSVSSGSS